MNQSNRAFAFQSENFDRTGGIESLLRRTPTLQRIDKPLRGPPLSSEGRERVYLSLLCEYCFRFALTSPSVPSRSREGVFKDFAPVHQDTDKPTPSSSKAESHHLEPLFERIDISDYLSQQLLLLGSRPYVLLLRRPMSSPRRR